MPLLDQGPPCAAKPGRPKPAATQTKAHLASFGEVTRGLRLPVALLHPSLQWLCTAVGCLLRCRDVCECVVTHEANRRRHSRSPLTNTPTPPGMHMNAGERLAAFAPPRRVLVPPARAQQETMPLCALGRPDRRERYAAHLNGLLSYGIQCLGFAVVRRLGSPWCIQS